MRACNMDPMDAGLPVGHQLVAAVIHFDLERVNAILDANEDLDLNALPGAALVYRPPAAWHRKILSNSGSILHVVASQRLPARDEFTEPMEAILTRLLRAGASPNATDYSGYTPLHWACEMASEWAIRPLLAHGAPVNTLDNDGSTPLHKLFRPSRADGYPLGVCRLPPHRTPPQRTHRTAHPRRRSHHPLALPCAQADAIGSLLEPMLEAGADPSIARKLDGLRPYDLLSRVARYGPCAVLAVRKGALTLSALSAGQLVAGRVFLPDSPPIAVSHTLSQLALSARLGS